jgi:polyribonucleotide nucleotidyltransferase
MQIHNVSAEIAGKTLTIETGQIALQSDGAVTVQYGDTVVLCTAMMSEKGPEESSFFRLTVEFQERFYASGKIKGSRFIKRDGRPSDEGILKARLIDRPIRPMFPKGITNEVQAIATILSADLENEPGVHAITGTSAAMMIAGHPFEGPLAAVRIGSVEGELIVFPTMQQVEEGDLDLVVAGTADAITMVEAGANEVSEETLLKALELAHGVIKQLCQLQLELRDKINPTPRKFTVSKPSDEILDLIKGVVSQEELDSVRGVLKKEIKDGVHALEDKVAAHFAAQIEDGTYNEGQLMAALDKIIFGNMRNNILEKGERIDGRKADEVRPITCKVGLIPRTHGSALFQRGETQALTLTTLGGPGAAQIIDTMDVDTTKTYIHYYNFPPYSVGDVRPLRGTSRREIGHGMLAERALRPVLPEKEGFAYTMLLVSEIMTCNGSSSMASVCGSTLSLMDAGVPIKKPVAGIAMGMVASDEFKETGQGAYTILSDIQGFEDFAGDMDFKVTGTADGVTALQMDIKVKGITIEMLREALTKANVGRAHIMSKMLEALPAHREKMSQYAPMITSIKIDPDFIRSVIGKGGETIQKITAECEVEMDIEQDGLVTITAPNQEAGDKAINWVKQIVYQPEVGEEFEGTVVSIQDFGAFVEFIPGKDGLVHISELRPYRVNKVSDVVSEGDKVKVKLVKVDDQGRYGLSMKEYYKDERAGGGAPAPKPAPQAPAPKPEPQAPAPKPEPAAEPKADTPDFF